MGNSFAQENEKYSLKFKAGSYTPEKNIDEYISGNLQLPPVFMNRHYVVIQFENLPDENVKLELSSGNIQIIEFLTGTAYTARLDASPDYQMLKSAGVRSIFVLEDKFKMDEGLLSGEIPEWAVKESGMVDLNVIPFEWISATELESSLKESGARILSEQKMFRIMEIRVPQKFLKTFVKSPWLQWMETVTPAPQDDNVPGKALHRSNVLNDGSRNLTGDGVKMGIWDGGTVGPHVDFAGRLVLAEPYLSSDHGTHVAGTMAGAGLLDPAARGMAPKALIYSYDYNGSVNTEVASAISTYAITMTQNSWGYGNDFVNCTVKDPYNANSRSQDLNIQNNPTLIHVHSAGNSQSVCTGGWGTTTGKAAKNKLVVANVSNSEVISSSSSFGPVQDGRLKPEISGMGTSVYSTLPNNAYTGGYSGTSMATPGVSGTIAQLVERYKQLNGSVNPPASLMKAIACNTAKDLGNAGPDYKFGFGRINGLQAVRAIEQNRYQIKTLSAGGSDSILISVPANTLRLRAMICWTDPAGAANANPALVNDLDLSVKDPSNTYWNPWILNPAFPGDVAVRGVDRLNNIEQVTLDNPAAGNYYLKVAAFALPVGPGQIYSITWEIEGSYLEMTYPNGGEVFVPGTSEIVYWDNSGATSTQTLQYSTNNGSTWTNMTTTLGSTASRYSWTIPNVASAQVRVRVTSGALTDMTDAVFTILGTPASFTLTPGCNAGLVTVSWSSVANATGYDVLLIDDITGAISVVASNVTGTNTVVSLSSSLGNTVFLTVRARNNTLGAVGNRAIAKSVLVPSGLALNPQVSPAGPHSLCDVDTVFFSGLNIKANNYQLSSIPYQNYTPGADISVSLGDDAISAALPIGFTFSFYGNIYTSFYIGSNGIIGFNPATLSAYQPQLIPNATAPNELIAFVWTDLNPATGGTISYLTTGVAPNRKLVVRFNNVRRYNSTATVDGRIELYEGSDIIEIHSNSVSSGTNTQGVENAGGTSAVPVPGRNQSSWSISTPEAQQFVPYNSSMIWYPGSVNAPTLLATSAGNYYFSIVDNGCTFYSDTVAITACLYPVSISVKAFIQGFYLGNGKLAGCLSPAITDTLILKLAQSAAPYTILFADTALLDTAGNAVFEFPASINSNSYYLVLNHRNSLETWSGAPLTMTSSSMSYDFTSSSLSAFGKSLSSTGDGRFAIWSGDINRDNQINYSDISLLDTYISQLMYGYYPGDLTGDNMTETADYSLLENNLYLNLQVKKP